MLRRSLLVVLLGAVAVLVGVSAARADGVFYFVTGFGDSGGACAPEPSIPGAIGCSTLRAAVAAASVDQGDDEIYLQPGTYTLSSEIALPTSVFLFGSNARTTTIQGNGNGRLFNVANGAVVWLYGMTLTGGVSGDEGGAVDNAGSLFLYESRVTGNQALSGGGIANEASGTLEVSYSLVDHNTTPQQVSSQGGGIINHGSLSVQDSTIALNQGDHVGGIYSDAQQTATFTHATVAGNVATGNGNPGGVSFVGPWTSDGSLFVANEGDSHPSNCVSAQTNGTDNLEDGGGCGFTSQPTGLPAAPITLADKGGMTDVVDIAGTRAEHFEPTCSSVVDQRLGQRQTGSSCDAGAYQDDVAPGPINPLFTIPTPTATPTPGPTPTDTPAPPPPTPEFHKDVVIKPVSGKVRVKLAGTNTFIDLTSATDIPLGSTIDVKAGKLQLSSVPKKNGKPQTATFFDGIFKITQPGGITDLKLNEALAACPKRGKASAAAAKKKPKTRKLWGNGSGAFRTSGTYSAATVRGTEWLVQDSCAGTLTQVKHGVVNVRDNVRHKTIVVRAGHRYLAKPKR